MTRLLRDKRSCIKKISLAQAVDSPSRQCERRSASIAAISLPQRLPRGFFVLPAARNPFRGPVQPIDGRAGDLLGRLTRDERMALLHQYASAVERLGMASLCSGTAVVHDVWCGGWS
ncbi:hypothetical protein [Streptomyces sp. NPDC057280]|uniref:hypothetical protein n=1 Tax=Streptomyces sp. NPDC057280 TaxID=3346081 RepID=UPI0036331B84